MPVICEGCGRPVTIPEGYRRNKIQCPCGVICPVPEAARQEADAAPARPRPAPAAKAPPSIEENAERWLLDDEPPAIEQSDEPPRFRDAEPDKPPVATQEPVWWPSVGEPEKADDEDASPYAVEGGEDVRCPQCSFMLPPGSVLCVRCGFHLKKRKKIAKTYQPIEREWETNYSLQTRFALFGFCELLALALGLFGVFWGGAERSRFFGPFFLFTGMMAFLLGTFARIRLTRDPRGRAQLTKTWRVGFYALQAKTTDVRGFEGIVSGQHRDVGNMDYAILLVLVVSGLIPGLIWWYLAFYKIAFHVSLSRDHGYPAYLVYSGWDEMQMKEIAYAVRDASGLHYDEG